MKVSVVLPTHNRCGELRETLHSLSRLRFEHPWEVLVVDNNSTDDTRAVVIEAARTFRVECRYVFEAAQGRYAAMNTGIHEARGAIIASIDDDARPASDWLDRAVSGLDRLGCDFVGGKVLPIWMKPRPPWLPHRRGLHWACLALLDLGEETKEFGPQVGWPLGVNMATRADAFKRAGFYDNRLGRKAGTLRQQSQREWHLRARAAGVRGFYLPDMIVHHVIPPERLQKRYFRRWAYWRGISRAILYDIARVDIMAPDESTLDFSTVPHILGVPRYMYRSVLLKSLFGTIAGRLKRDPVAAFEHELWLCFFAGVLKQRLTDPRGGPEESADVHARAEAGG